MDGRERYLKLLILKKKGVPIAWPTGLRPHFFRWRKLGCGFKSPHGNFRFFFSFIVFLPFGFYFLLETFRFEDEDDYEYEV